MLLKMLKGSMGGTRRPPTGLSVHGHQRWEIAMTDPRDFDRRMEMEHQMEMERRMGAPTVWGWIAGAVFIIVILALVFAGGESTRTAREDANPPATTGMAPRTAPPAVAVPPAQQPSTTGQSQ
jgi:hypothetical protein